MTNSSVNYENRYEVGDYVCKLRRQSFFDERIKIPMHCDNTFS